ncbi:MAG: glycosyltransferase family 39 protein [Candidatus Omnitrophota bacterium]
MLPQEGQFMKSADEGYYFKYASLILKNGITEFPSLIEWYTGNEEAQLHPNPSRVGYILFIALSFKIFGISFTSLAQVSFLSFFLFLVVSFYFSNKHFGKNTALIYTLFLSSSPLIMAMARRALSDSCGNLFYALTIWLFFDFLTQNNKIKYSIFLLAYALCIMVRESSLVLLPFFAGFFCLYKYAYKRKISHLYLWGIMLIPVSIVGICYLILFAGFKNMALFIETLFGIHFGVQDSQYAILFCGGPWYRYIVDYMVLEPLTMCLFIGYFIYILLIKKFDFKTMFFVIYFTIVFLIMGNLQYTKVLRLVINLDMVINLFAVWAIYELFKQKNKNYQNYFVFIFSMIIFIANYLTFLDLFICKEIYDPVSYWLLKARGFIP